MSLFQLSLSAITFNILLINLIYFAEISNKNQNGIRHIKNFLMRPNKYTQNNIIWFFCVSQFHFYSLNENLAHKFRYNYINQERIQRRRTYLCGMIFIISSLKMLYWPCCNCVQYKFNWFVGVFVCQSIDRFSNFGSIFSVCY